MPAASQRARMRSFFGPRAREDTTPTTCADSSPRSWTSSQFAKVVPPPEMSPTRRRGCEESPMEWWRWIDPDPGGGDSCLAVRATWRRWLPDYQPR